MSEEDTIHYRKLYRHVSSFDSGGLYEGDDHILLIEGLVYQRYYRFYFDSIQSIQIRRTKRTLIELASLFGVALLISFIVSLFDLSSAEFRLDIMLQIVLAGPFVLLGTLCLLRFLLCGASQQVVIQTPVQRKVLSPLGFRRSAKKVVDRMVARVNEVQGTFPSSEALQEHLKNWAPKASTAGGSSTVKIEPIQDLRKSA